LHKCVKTSLLLLAPITPFVTDHLWKTVYSKKSVHTEILPKAEKADEAMLKLTGDLTSANEKIWKQKKDGKLSMKETLASAELPSSLRSMEGDLAAMHNLGKIEWK